MKIDALDEIFVQARVLDCAAPLGLIALVATFISSRTYPNCLKYLIPLSILYALGVAISIAWWNCMDRAHGPESRIADHLWWR